MKYNYASVEIKREGDDIRVDLAVKNYENDDVLKKVVLVKRDL